MDNRVKNAGKAIQFSFIPLLACVIYAAMQGVMLWEINNYAAHLPQYNDGIFYVKQIDAMVRYGMPQGYFGYNESAAQIGTLASWPVFIYYPYVLMGKLFGFSATHMMAFNIAFVQIAFFVFYYLAKPTVKNSAFILLFMLAVPAIPRYMLSCMTEPLFYAAVILFAGFFAHYSSEKYSRKSIYICYALTIFFALCRPYMMIFIIIPMFYHLKINWIETGIASLASVGIFAGLYVGYASPRTAKYIEQTIDTSIFTVLRESGIFEFVRATFQKFNLDAKELRNVIMQNFQEVYIPYKTLGFLLALFVVFTVITILKRKKINDVNYMAAALVFIVVFAVVAALIIFYVEYTSFRHIFVIICFMIIMAAMYMTDNKIVLLLSIAFIMCFSWINIGDVDIVYDLPTSNDEFNTMPSEADALLLQEKLLENTSDEPWDNTLIYVYCNGIMNYLHYVPSQMGINICFSEYIVEHANDLKSKYILAIADQKDLEILKDNGWERVIDTTEYVLYQKIK